MAVTQRPIGLIDVEVGIDDGWQLQEITQEDYVDPGDICDHLLLQLLLFPVVSFDTKPFGSPGWGIFVRLPLIVFQM
jgi:hypothetical protein